MLSYIQPYKQHAQWLTCRFVHLTQVTDDSNLAMRSHSNLAKYSNSLVSVLKHLMMMLYLPLYGKCRVSS